MSEIYHQTSHLTVLIDRVKKDEQQLNYATKEHLVNLAKFILTWPGKFSKSEYDESIRILAQYHLASLAAPKVGWKLIQKELARSYKARCKRCGLPITNRTSLLFGHGPVCRRKLGLENKHALEERPAKEVCSTYG
jgi:hypothetical protein